jgi:hypothetical protein
MSHTLTVLSAKPTFGTINNYMSQNDYLTSKKAKALYCTTPIYCNKLKIAPTYEYKYLYTQGRYELGLLNFRVNALDTGDLINGQYTNFNLKNICTIANGNPTSKQCSYTFPCDPCQNNTAVIVNTNALEPFYFNKTIDPLGELFGKTQCGEFNYNNYVELVAPTNIQGIVLGNK